MVVNRFILIFILSIICSCKERSDYKCECNAYGRVSFAGSEQSKYYSADVFANSTADDARTKCDAFSAEYKAEYLDTVQKQDGWLDCKLNDLHKK